MNGDDCQLKETSFWEYRTHFLYNAWFFQLFVSNGIPAAAKWYGVWQTNAPFCRRKGEGGMADKRKMKRAFLFSFSLLFYCWISYIYRIYGAADCRKQTVAPRAFSAIDRKLTERPLGGLKLDISSRKARESFCGRTAQGKIRERGRDGCIGFMEFRERIESRMRTILKVSFLLWFNLFFVYDHGYIYIYKCNCMHYTIIYVRLKRLYFQ